ncbi:MAG: hypothetical protein Unbinned6224contig1001_42 [Prokaryotic dsDNA virus sp.]|nr:MAG: hypothetical protein Unbinned6224contig1001_42 [Prokaryotic dsDNA virus sp.]|tara:strand:- start:12707 stop:12958 length:252 start_codon:yes stop_codon:yes gene_type:complete
MAEQKKQKPDSITLPNGKEYIIQDLSKEAQMLTHHLRDQTNKMGNMRFNLEQIQYGYDSILDKLMNILGEKMPEEGEVIEQAK